MATTRHVACVQVLAVVAAVSLAAQPPAPGYTPSWQWRVATDDRVPLWLAMPSQARILTSAGVRFEPHRSSGITFENLRLGVLVGALKNTGRCASDLRVFLQYTDDRWRPLGDPIESEARVTRVETGETLPFRFRLRVRDDFDTLPSGISLHVIEQDRPLAQQFRLESLGPEADGRPCPPRLRTISGRVTRMVTHLSDRFVVEGELEVDGERPRDDAIAVTVVVFDRDDQVLDVLTGTPDPPDDDQGRPSAVVPFRLTTPIPIGRQARRSVVVAEVLDDVRRVP